jgi:hypothetical protein
MNARATSRARQLEPPFRILSPPFGSSLGSGPERAAKDIPLPLGYPIDLADQRKPLVKLSLIIVNASVAMIKASGNGNDDQNSPCRTAEHKHPIWIPAFPRYSPSQNSPHGTRQILRPICGRDAAERGTKCGAPADCSTPVGNCFFARFGGPASCSHGRRAGDRLTPGAIRAPLTAQTPSRRHGSQVGRP